MHRRTSLLLVLAVIGSGLFATPPARADDPLPEVSGTVVRAGYGETDNTWHVGAGAGQYSKKWPENCEDPSACDPTSKPTDPHSHATTQTNSYGVQSRLSFRTIVVDDGTDQAAFVKSDNYLAMDALARRVSQILSDADSSISYDEIFHMASHNHFSPMYSTPSWGVWAFQDAFDIRAYEYQARQMAESILEAEDNLTDAKMGATTVEHKLFKGMVARRQLTDDGTPGGYPLDFGDFGLSVVRFDSIDPAKPGPIATMVNWGMHPEGLETDNLITAEFLAPLERYVERATGGGVVFGQGDVGSSESGPGHPYDFPEGVYRQWDNAGHAQVERGGLLLARDVIKAWNQIGRGEAIVPFSSSFDVEAGNAFIPGPLSHPYPSVSNCRTETTAEGAPGAPVAGVPDCERGPLGANRDQMVWENLRAHGLPIPEHYDAPSFTGVEENLRLRLQAFKLGEVILMSCACEAQVDLILNLESRVDEEQGNMWLGYDWTKRLDCTQASPPDGDWTCVRRTDDPAAPGSTFTSPLTFTDARRDRMMAQIYNDAKGWNASDKVLEANADPADTSKIWGNFTHEELPADLGYKLPIGVGHAGDYNGYTVSYREYMAYDHYRKALTAYGPHTADYMNTTLVKLARELNDGDADDTYDFESHEEPRAAADEARQEIFTTALGRSAQQLYDGWKAALPNDVGPAAGTQQPSNIKRFNAATFSWRGGSNAVDNPTVKIQREVDGGWVDFADQSGEIQTKVALPEGVSAFATTYAGQQEWIWTANFEAFNAMPKPIGSTPAGRYRFVVDGLIRQEMNDDAYHLESDPFIVSPWDGVQVRNLRSEGDGVSFTVDPIVYPDTYSSVFPYVRRHNRSEVGGDRELRPGEARTWCDTCSFRPWATGANVATATISVLRSDGSIESHTATCTGSACTASVALGDGDFAFVPRGAVVDSYGESNASCVALDSNEACDVQVIPDLDADDDGFENAADNCVTDPNPDQSDLDGDFKGDACDADRDGDRVDDSSDNCPGASNVQQDDVDGDGLGDACDSDPTDGPLGDADEDGTINRDDTDPLDPCRPDDSADGCDSDGDGAVNGTDNCPGIPNADQRDNDGDTIGDECDDTPDGSPADADRDGTPDASDNCPAIANADQSDTDNDGIGNSCDDTPNGPPADDDGDGVVNTSDNCPGIANPGQADSDGDGDGNACDETPNGPPSDSDGDGVSDASDNCPGTSNSSQTDSDSDGSGNSCDSTPFGSGGGGGGGGQSSPPASSPPASNSPAGAERGTGSTSIAASVVKTDHGADFTISGVVSGDRTCTFSTVEILKRTYGSDESASVASAQVTADGTWSTTMSSAMNASYTARPSATERCDGQMSSPVDVLVRAKVIPQTMRCDVMGTLRGRVAPNLAGTKVALQRKTARGSWKRIDVAELNDRSRFVFRQVPSGCRATRVVWTKQDVRNERGSAVVRPA